MQPECFKSGDIYHLDELLNTVPCGFLTFTDDGKIVVVNATLLQLLGYELDELRGQRIDSILPMAGRIFYQTHFFPLLKLHGKVEEIYISLRHKQGNTLPVLVNAVRQELSGVFINECIFVLVRQRVRYEDELLQAKKDAQAAILAENQANARLQQAQIALESKQAELLELNAKLEEQVQQRTAQLQQALNFESLLQRIADKVRDSLDEEQILQAAVQELGVELAIEYCDVEIYNLDQAQPIVAYEYNQSLTLAPGQALKITSVIPVIASVPMQGEVLQLCSIISHGLLHNPKQLAILACPIYDDRGVLGNLCLFRQKEETFSNLEIRLVQQVANHCAIALRQSRLYQAAQLQVQELKRLNQLKNDFLSTISHELRTPMSSMKMALQMLEICLLPLGVFEQETNPINHYFQILQTESQQELDLIDTLLELAHTDASTAPLNLSPIHLHFWLPHVVEPFIHRTSNQEQYLKVWVQEDLPPFMADLTYLGRVLTELLQNACKYTPAGETINVSARFAVDSNRGNIPCLRIEVSNSGVEIPEIERDRIFDKFYRIPNNDPWKHGGTGLGLALVKKLVEHMSGSIWVESSQNLTQFILQFPLNLE